MDKLKPCPFCGGEGCIQEHRFYNLANTYGVVCLDCCCETRQFFETEQKAIEAWNKRTTHEKISIPGLFDKEEVIEGCTVQILTNTVTGERSVGWWRGRKDEMLKKEDSGSEKV